MVEQQHTASQRGSLSLQKTVPWRVGLAFLFLLIIGSAATASVYDRREEIARETARYRAAHFPDGRMPPKHHWSGPPTSTASGTVSLTDTRATPGGVGFGYYFNNSALLWTNCSIADYYVDAPTYLGGNVTNYLYLTSTCRAQLGTESLVEYDGSGKDAQFWIFDWSQEEAGNYPWVVFLDLAISNPQYLTTRPDEFAAQRQMTHVRNGTYYLGYSNGLCNWQNQTLLFDFNRGGWDLIYSTNYTTTKLSANLPQSGGESVGFWGPIVEAFGTYPGINPVGFDLIRLFQDGNPSPFWLSSSNTSIEENINGSYGVSNYYVISQATNTSFAISCGANNNNGSPPVVGTLCVTANINLPSFTLSPPAGLISPYWITTPNSNSWDNTIVGLTPGPYTIAFNPPPGEAAPPPQSFTITSNTITTVNLNYIAEPALLGASVNGQTLASIWSAPTNYSWQVQCTTNLAQGWTNWGSPIAPANGQVTISDSINGYPQRFYRLELVP